MSAQSTWCIGNIVLGLESDSAEPVRDTETSYSRFSTEADRDVVLTTHSGAVPDLSLAPPIFDCGVWSLHRSGDQLVWRMPAVSWEGPAEYLLTFHQDQNCGEVWINPGRYWDADFPLNRPLGEVLFSHLLTVTGRGVLFHACGIAQDGRGTLFAGVSGAGKTTMSRLWLPEPDVTLLNDDRIIIRERDGAFWMYSTPWHGEEKSVANLEIPLERIFIIEHGPRNSASRLRPSRAVSAMLARSFPSHWDADGMRSTLGFLETLSKDIPCYKLEFLPDRSVVEYINSSSVR